MRRFVGLALLGVIALGGCRYKGGESFMAATTPNPAPQWTGDPYTDAGYAESSGGLISKTTYGLGANPNATAKLNADFDQPAKGVGGQPGENPVEAYPGFGNSNAPINQPRPQDVSPMGTRTDR